MSDSKQHSIPSCNIGALYIDQISHFDVKPNDDDEILSILLAGDKDILQRQQRQAASCSSR